MRSAVKLYRVRLAKGVADKVHDAPLRTSMDVVSALSELLADRDRESFGVVHLDARSQVRGFEISSTGSLLASLVHPREVFKGAILANSASIILFHNHPSGDPSYSGEDLSITRRLVECGELLGITVLDHVIVAPGGNHFSFVNNRIPPFAPKGA